MIPCLTSLEAVSSSPPLLSQLGLEMSSFFLPWHSQNFPIALPISGLNSASRFPASTEMIVLKCKQGFVFSRLKLTNRIFQTFHGSPLPDNRAQMLPPGTQSPAASGSSTFSSLSCHICSHAVHPIPLSY